MLKLLSALPAGWQRDAQRVGARFHLDSTGWYQQAGATDHLAEIAEAVWNERRLSISYESWKGLVDRRLDPLGLVLKAGVWYLAARPASGGSRRCERSAPARRRSSAPAAASSGRS